MQVFFLVFLACAVYCTSIESTINSSSSTESTTGTSLLSEQKIPAHNPSAPEPRKRCASITTSCTATSTTPASNFKSARLSVAKRFKLDSSFVFGKINFYKEDRALEYDICDYALLLSVRQKLFEELLVASIKAKYKNDAKTISQLSEEQIQSDINECELLQEFSIKAEWSMIMPKRFYFVSKGKSLLYGTKGPVGDQKNFSFLESYIYVLLESKPASSKTNVQERIAENCKFGTEHEILIKYQDKDIREMKITSRSDALLDSYARIFTALHQYKPASSETKKDTEAILKNCKTLHLEWIVYYWSHWQLLEGYRLALQHNPDMTLKDFGYLPGGKKLLRSFIRTFNSDWLLPSENKKMRFAKEEILPTNRFEPRMAITKLSAVYEKGTINANHFLNL